MSVSSQPQPLLTTTHAAGGSATGPNAIGSEDGGGGSGTAATARTFSLDDLLRPPPRRTPSPRKKRNNSTPSKPNSCNAAEKKQILQQLLGPAGGMEKIPLNELISIGSSGGGNGGCSIRETVLSEGPEILELANDAKLEKKVTFARLLNKVSAEMSSSSETTSTTPRLSSLPTHHNHHHGHQSSGLLSANGFGNVIGQSQHHRRTSSMPPSPSGLDGVRLDIGARSTASTQSSDSMSSTELMLMPTSTIVDQHQQPTNDTQSSSSVLQQQHQRHGSVGSSAASLPVGPSTQTSMSTAAVGVQRNLRPKVSSADSLLTMFRNFTAGRNASTSGVSNATVAATSERSALSPSSSMATSSTSPHDDLAGIGGCGDDDSSTSSLHTPVSFNSMSNGIQFEVSAVELLRAAECAEANEAAAKTTSRVISTESDGLRNEHQENAQQHHYTQQHNIGSGNYLVTASGIQLDLPANINQCLSPIREMPTPMPSPALTPVMMRQYSFGMRFGGRNRGCGDESEHQDDENEADEQLQIERNVSSRSSNYMYVIVLDSII